MQRKLRAKSNETRTMFRFDGRLVDRVHVIDGERRDETGAGKHQFSRRIQIQVL